MCGSHGINVQARLDRMAIKRAAMAFHDRE